MSSASAAITLVSSAASSARSSCSAACSATFSPASAASRVRCELISRPREVDLQRAELGDQIAVATCRVGLALERSELTAHLAKQILHAQQAGLGGVETTLGALLATAELQHAGGFFDDRSTLFGAGVQHRVDLALADDHVLLTADTRVAEQLLHVEQATGRRR